MGWGVHSNRFVKPQTDWGNRTQCRREEFIKRPSAMPRNLTAGKKNTQKVVHVQKVQNYTFKKDFSKNTEIQTKNNKKTTCYSKKSTENLKRFGKTNKRSEMYKKECSIRCGRQK